jgi:hypothetical protein
MEPEEMADKVARYEAALWRILSKPKEQVALIRHLKATGQKVTAQHDAELWIYLQIAHIAADALDLNGYEFHRFMNSSEGGHELGSLGKDSFFHA